MKHVTTTDLAKMKQRGEKVVMVTAYDYPTACLVDEAGVDVVLVGDSLGNVVLGYGSTLPVTIEDMLHHTKAVVRGVKRALVVTDLLHTRPGLRTPFAMPGGSYRKAAPQRLNWREASKSVPRSTHWSRRESR